MSRIDVWLVGFVYTSMEKKKPPWRARFNSPGMPGLWWWSISDRLGWASLGLIVNLSRPIVELTEQEGKLGLVWQSNIKTFQRLNKSEVVYSIGIFNSHHFMQISIGNLEVGSFRFIVYGLVQIVFKIDWCIGYLKIIKYWMLPFIGWGRWWEPFERNSLFLRI